jgi:uncharacterized membrane protein YqhA
MHWIAERGARVILLVAILPAFVAAAAVALFTLALAAQRTWEAGRSLAEGELSSTTLKTEFVGLVSLTLTSVVFYLVAMGLLSLFVAPGIRTRGLHVRSLADLEVKVMNVIVVVLATTFLERFTETADGAELLRLAAALALVVGAILGFQLALRGRIEQGGELSVDSDHG